MHAIQALMKSLRRSETAWRYLYNFKPAIAWRLNGRPSFSGDAARVVRDLREDGIAVTSVRALLGANDAFEELNSATRKLELENARRLAEARRLAQAPSGDGAEKHFTYELLGARPVLEPESVFVRFALQPRVLDIANAHYGMYTRLRQWNVWHTFATQAPARSSQLWHRDWDDLHHILKVFVYLTDVDDGCGPFTYARGSHRIDAEPEYLYREGATTRSDDAQMARLVPQSRWLKCTGRAGAMVFADTHGYHKGGLARTADRLMYILMYTSPMAHRADLITRSSEPAPAGTRQAAAALAPPGS